MSDDDTRQAVADTLLNVAKSAATGGWEQLFEETEKELNEQLELNDSLAAKVAEWKARAEKAEAALKAVEDDRHLTTPCA